VSQRKLFDERVTGKLLLFAIVDVDGNPAAVMDVSLQERASRTFVITKKCSPRVRQQHRHWRLFSSPVVAASSVIGSDL
jgi:hypothetical protein